MFCFLVSQHTEDAHDIFAKLLHPSLVLGSRASRTQTATQRV